MHGDGLTLCRAHGNVLGALSCSVRRHASRYRCIPGGYQIFARIALGWLECTFNTRTGIGGTEDMQQIIKTGLGTYNE